jgi:hypothetical protein
VSDRESQEQRPPAETEIAQTTPKGLIRSYDEMNTGQMVFELQGTVHELKASITTLRQTVERGFARIEGLERTSTEIREVLRALDPKLENLAGFATHRAPHLADKADLVAMQGQLRAEIEKRPTRRQAIADVVLIALA